MLHQRCKDVMPCRRPNNGWKSGWAAISCILICHFRVVGSRVMSEAWHDIRCMLHPVINRQAVRHSHYADVSSRHGAFVISIQSN